MKKLIPFLLLSACNTIPHEARTAMVGMTVTDVFACAGKPDKYQEISKTDWILQYNQDTDVQSDKKISYGSLISLEFGSTGRCHAIFRIHDNYLVSVHFSGPSLTYTGANGACVPLIKECVTRQDHTSIPEGYNIKDYLKGD